MFDFEIQRCTRRCAETDRSLEPGEAFFSVLEPLGSDVIRRDYSTDAWNGPPENALGWWKSRMPEPNSKKTTWAPNDVMLDLFQCWADDVKRLEIRYVLALLLIRRRVFRQEHEDTALGQRTEEKDEVGPGEAGGRLLVYCPRKEQRYELPIAVPNDERAEEIQQELAKLLFAEGK